MGTGENNQNPGEIPEGMVAVPGWGVVWQGQYAFPGPLRDQIVQSILAGQKTATSSLWEAYQREGDPLPVVGDLEAVMDSHGQPVCITRTTGVDIVRLSDVTDDHARREGEGFQGFQDWKVAHERFWTSREYIQSLGEPELTLNHDSQVVCVSFAVVQRLSG